MNDIKTSWRTSCSPPPKPADGGQHGGFDAKNPIVTGGAVCTPNGKARWQRFGGARCSQTQSASLTVGWRSEVMW
jgi:hypothetical protein